MAVKIRYMSWNIENYGSAKEQKSPDLPKIIAKTMQLYEINILAILEIQKNGQDTILKKIQIELNNIVGYKKNWKAKFVNVGDEGVAFIWHEADDNTPNSFKAMRYIDDAQPISGRVIKNEIGNLIYFPKTGTPWNSLPIASEGGRRPSYMVFQTNNGDPPVNFSCLDMHAPFNATTSIQAYSAKLYASSFEIAKVLTQNAALKANSSSIKDSEKNKALESVLNIKTLAATKNDNFKKQIATMSNVLSKNIALKINEENSKAYSFLSSSQYKLTLTKGVRIDQLVPVCYKSLKNSGYKEQDLFQISTILIISYLTALITLASGASNSDVDKNIKIAILDCLDIFIISVPKYTGGKRNAWINNNAKAGFEKCKFTDATSTNIAKSFIAGDFNINFPDIQDYGTSLGAPTANAYTALQAIGETGIKKSMIEGIKTTRSTSDSGKNEYKVKNPLPTSLNSSDNTKGDWIPPEIINGLQKIAGKTYDSYNDFSAALKMNSGNTDKNFTWHAYLASRFACEIEYFNDTEIFLASAYDNIFIKSGGLKTGNCADILGELGCWAKGDHGMNSWKKANGNLNQIAKSILTPFSETPYFISKTIDNAMDASIFYKEFISDHFPVLIEVEL